MSKHHHEPTEPPVNEAKRETKQHPEGEKEQPSIIQPIIDDLKGQTKTHYPSIDELGAPNPPGPGHPPQPAELDQDPGGGYNPDGTYPQT